jgi:aspartyl protease family protein
MPDQQGPWRQTPQPRQAGSRVRLILWLLLIFAIGAGIWKLAELFPGQLSSGLGQAYLVQLVVILALVSGGLIFARHMRFGELARNLAIWVGVALVLAIGFAFQSELKDIGLRLWAELLPGNPLQTSPDVVVLTESADGHFYAMGNVNGSPVRFLIDTGASETVLSPSDAKRIGIDTGALSFSHPYQTANGIGLGAAFTLRTLSIGSIELFDMPVSINQADMGTSLLGMSFLRRLRSFEFQGRRLFLRWH